MNILLLTDGITPYVTGGMQKHSYVMAKLLAKNNCTVTLVHCGITYQHSFNQHYSDIFTEKEREYITPIFVPFIKMGKLPGHYIKESKWYSKRIGETYNLNQELPKFDLIYAQGFTGWHFLENKHHIPVIVNLHGYEMFQKAPNLKVKLEHFLLRPFVKQTLKKADYVLSFGGEIDRIISSLNVPNSKLIQQSNGIETNWITTNQPKTLSVKTFTFIGRYERRKGIEELTIALKQLIKDEKNFIFNFIGPIAKEHQINHSQINYLGEIKNANKIKSILDDSDFLISPSYSEGMPTVILESMARGNAIIATNVGANSRMINQNGILIDSTPISIENGIKKALQLNDSELLKMKQKSIKLVKNQFTWESVIQQQLVEFRKVIQ